MKNCKHGLAILMAVGLFGVLASAYSDPLAVSVQRRGGGGGGGGGARSSGGGGGGGGQQAHARREGVRTQNYVTRTQGGTYQKAPPLRQSIPPRNPPTINRGAGAPPVRRTGGGVNRVVQNQRTFTKTAQGRRYDNGLVLRKGVKVTAGWEREYFPRGYVHFPFYRQRFVAGACFYSPFSFYFGVCLPFIDISVCETYPPAVDFVDVPVYNGNNWAGYSNVDSGNMIDDPNLDQNEPGLNNALDELAETFQGGNIDGIVSLINPNMQIAIFLRGHYKYSMQANNYIDMTRDAIQSMQTVQFSLNYLHQRSPGVFCASGQHTYTDRQGRTRTVYVSFVLQDIGGLWTLTQVETCPDVVQKF